ncbi:MULTISPECIES: carbohydrate ABC transporter permease [unclassified Clostridium]|uniref:carbohydrate ABC transporter permease n=1 Tax=unclassified Clostridium TaxID=2614128 RepID=UPI000297824D|nr:MULTISPECIES: carbohydrate ABC transporter permease [unclassified Clostridium]EKQ57922.1 MAG: ABC-type sugar transport system, permease component [Clostridium sp. Maddingley MBC34-26]
MKNKRLIANIIKYIVISGLLLVYIVPFIFVLINSFKARKDVVANPLALASDFKFSNYIDAFEKMNYGHAFINTLIITVLSVLIIIIFSSMTAYILVRKDWKLNKVIFFAMVLSMIIPFQGIMIPLVSIYGSMGMLNTKWALIYMYLGFGMSLAVFMYHGFIKSIPVELEEAAMIDGASRFQTFWQIVFPIMKPITMTITTLDVLWIWNDFLLPSLILIAPNERTLQLSTYAFNGTYTTDYGLSMSALMLSILPVLIIYLFLQKSIIGGVLQGSIK